MGKQSIPTDKGAFLRFLSELLNPVHQLLVSLKEIAKKHNCETVTAAIEKYNHDHFDNHAKYGQADHIIGLLALAAFQFMLDIGIKFGRGGDMTFLQDIL